MRPSSTTTARWEPRKPRPWPRSTRNTEKRVFTNSTSSSPDFAQIDRLFQEGVSEGRQGVVACLVVRPDGRVFAQRRSPTRKLFPGCWDLVGGHLEPGESPRQALERELNEETGWILDRLLGLRKVVDWESPGEGTGAVRKREFVVAVTVKGGWDSPRLETAKVSEGRWFGPSDLAALKEDQTGEDGYVREFFVDWFKENPISLIQGMN